MKSTARLKQTRILLLAITALGVPLIVLLGMYGSLLLPEAPVSPNRIPAAMVHKTTGRGDAAPPYRVKRHKSTMPPAANGSLSPAVSIVPFPEPGAAEEPQLNREPLDSVATDDGVFDIAEVEASIINAALKNIPVDMQEFGQLKEYYAGVDNLRELHRFIGSLPDSYEMKIPILEDLALFHAERGQAVDSIDLVESIQDHNDTVRIKYIKADIYWWAGDPASAVYTLHEATQIATEPYQYERMSQIVASSGDEAGASYYTELADALKSSLPSDE